MIKLVNKREYEAMRERLEKLESAQAAREEDVRREAKMQKQWDALYAYDGTQKEGSN